jgi:ribosomal protein S18 acetylase RimI-like enzyme
MSAALPEALLSRVEDAGLNASAPPQQRWIDGWLVRYSPGKAKRARCVNAVADGRLGLDERLEACRAVYAAAALPMIVRITPFSRPDGLDEHLADRGYAAFDDTRVMVATALPDGAADAPPAGYVFERLSPADYADAIGALRGSPPEQRSAHAQRLVSSPTPFDGWVLRRVGGEVAACGQVALEANVVGLYDVYTDPAHRSRGLGRWLCRELLARARAAGARLAYLQVDADNAAARAVYARLGFADAYAYHYRSPQPES